MVGVPGGEGAGAVRMGTWGAEGKGGEGYRPDLR